MNYLEDIVEDITYRHELTYLNDMLEELHAQHKFFSIQLKLNPEDKDFYINELFNIKDEIKEIKSIIKQYYLLLEE
jgi:hypothetical protein